MASAGEVECVYEHMHPDINELLSEAVRRYPILYDKTLKEFKDCKRKLYKLKISQFTYGMLASLPRIIFPVTQPKFFDEVIVRAIGSSCFLLKYWAYPTFSWCSCLVLETFSCLLIRKNNTMANATGSASAILFSLLDL